MSLFFTRQSLLFEADDDNQIVDSTGDSGETNNDGDNTEANNDSSEENNSENTDTETNDNDNDDENSDNDNDDSDNADDEDYSIDAGDDDNESMNDDDSSDSDDSSSDSDNSDSSSSSDSTDSEEKSLDRDLFSTLTDDEKKRKIATLKRLYIDLYAKADVLIDKFNQIDSDLDENMNAIVKRILTILYDMKEYVSYYVLNVFDKASYIENDIVFNRYLSILNGIKVAIEDLEKEREKEDKRG